MREVTEDCGFCDRVGICPECIGKMNDRLQEAKMMLVEMCDPVSLVGPDELHKRAMAWLGKD